MALTDVSGRGCSSSSRMCKMSVQHDGRHLFTEQKRNKPARTNDQTARSFVYFFLNEGKFYLQEGGGINAAGKHHGNVGLDGLAPRQRCSSIYLSSGGSAQYHRLPNPAAQKSAQFALRDNSDTCSNSTRACSRNTRASKDSRRWALSFALFLTLSLCISLVLSSSSAKFQ